MKILICLLGLWGYALWGFEKNTKVAMRRIILNIAVFFEVEILIVPKISIIYTNNICLAWVLLVNRFP
jgi:hypothetical protein